MKYSPVRAADGRPLLTFREACYGLWGLSATLASCGINVWLNPPPQPFAGRLAWLYQFADARWGSPGPAVVILAFAAAFLVLGLLVWRRATRLSTLDSRPGGGNDL